MKLYLYGDSNTYGFDPRDPFGGRYPEDARWPDLLQKELGDSVHVIADGMNGREIPSGGYAMSYLKKKLQQVSPIDLFAVMLGTNDMLGCLGRDPDGIVREMERFCRDIETFLCNFSADPDAGKDLDVNSSPMIAIIAPPMIRIPEISEKSMQELYSGYRFIADLDSWKYVDTTGWGLDLAYDGIHLSEDGHRTFAKKMAEWVRQWA